jgi:hypothetical protein
LWCLHFVVYSVKMFQAFRKKSEERAAPPNARAISRRSLLPIMIQAVTVTAMATVGFSLLVDRGEANTATAPLSARPRGGRRYTKVKARYESNCGGNEAYGFCNNPCMRVITDGPLTPNPWCYSCRSCGTNCPGYPGLNC